MYRQITSEERYTLGALHAQGLSQAEIARRLGRHPSVARQSGCEARDNLDENRVAAKG
ncbi:MAG: helix-turn-helix domain-containing protein [Burkholderiales bacterium]